MTRCETCVGYNRLRPKQVLDASAVDPCGNCECGECRNGIERLRAEIERLQGIAGDVFVEGAKWWEWHETGATMWQSDQQTAAEEAARRKMPFHEPVEKRLEAEIERLTQIANDALDAKANEKCRRYEAEKALAFSAETIESLRALVAAQMERLREMSAPPRAEREPR